MRWPNSKQTAAFRKYNTHDNWVQYCRRQHRHSKPLQHPLGRAKNQTLNSPVARTLHAWCGMHSAFFVAPPATRRGRIRRREWRATEEPQICWAPHEVTPSRATGLPAGWAATTYRGIVKIRYTCACASSSAAHLLAGGVIRSCGNWFLGLYLISRPLNILTKTISGNVKEGRFKRHVWRRQSPKWSGYSPYRAVNPLDAWISYSVDELLVFCCLLY